MRIMLLTEKKKLIAWLILKWIFLGIFILLKNLVLETYELSKYLSEEYDPISHFGLSKTIISKENYIILRRVLINLYKENLVKINLSDIILYV